MTGGVATARTVLRIARAEELTFLAAAIAYYAFVSLIPAALLAVAVATLVGGAPLAERVAGATGEVLAPAARRELESAIAGDAGRSGATAVGALGLLWSTLKVFRGLDVAFSAVYDTAAASTILGRVRDALVVVLAVGVAVAAMIGVGGALVALRLPARGGVVGLGLLFAGLVAAFLPLYYVLPDGDVRVREAVPGAVLAAAGWVTLQALFQVYSALAGTYEVYGVIGGVLLVVTWFYAAAILLLLGAAVNVVLSRDGNRQRQGAAPRHGRTTPMAEEDGDPTDGDAADGESGVEAELRELRADLESFEAAVEERTVHRSELEAELRRYVRDRVRRGHARGWGPYLVLLYGTAMTVGAFYFLSGGWAILAMIVIWLSTLGLYVLMVLVGAAVGAARLPRDAVDALRDWRS